MDARVAGIMVVSCAAAVLACCAGAGCRTRPLPPIDLTESGARVRHGQAVWKPAQDQPELAGELTVATRSGGDALVEFAKPPFSIAVAHVSGDRWQVSYPGHGRRSRKGSSQDREDVWLQLARVFAGGAATGPWEFQTGEGGSWSLANRVTGESLEGYLDP